jgi:hypothetical protein
LVVVETAIKLAIREVFEVLYSPVNAFRKIIKKPDVKGVILILVLVITSTVLVQSIVYSKFFLENRMPENDDWTESRVNQHYWISNGLLSLDDMDYEMGNADGNHSIASSVQSENIWMQITGIAVPVNSSEERGYTELFFWIKWIDEGESAPNSGTLKLFSNGENSYFEKDITNLLASNEEWINATLNVGPDQGWDSISSPSWQNITGIEFNLNWTASANLTMKIDGLFFRKFSSPVLTGEFGALILTIVVQATITFAISWILWSGILILVGKLFQVDLGQWKVFFVIIGYVFIATFVYTLVEGLFIFTLPPLNLSLDPNAANALLNELWTPLLAYQLTGIIQLIGEVWVAALCAVVVRLMREVTWGKAATIAAVAFGVRLLLNLFLGV